MEKNVGNADRHDHNLTNEEVGFAASKYENDDVNEGELYGEKIEETVIVKKNKVHKKGWSKGKSRMSTNDVDKKKKKKVKTAVVDSHEAITELQEFITGDAINGSDMKLVIQKTLTASDLKRNQNRLNMPTRKVKTHDFLTPEEKLVLGVYGRRKDGAKPGQIKVQIVGPNLQMHKKPLSLKIWHLVNSENYVLKTNWSNFVEENKKFLKENTTIQVWSFRKDGKLCFAVVSVDKPVGEHNAT